MPNKIPHPCNYPGCCNLSHEYYCKSHKKYKKVYDDVSNDKKADPFYLSPAWRNAAKIYVRSHPICEKCKLRVSDLVDHKIEIKDGGDKLNSANFQALCHKCHQKKTWMAKFTKMEIERQMERIKTDLRKFKL